MSRLLGNGGCPPAALGGLATYRPQTSRATETREMVEVTDADGRVEATLPLGHPSVKDYEASGFTVRVVVKRVDERGRIVG